LKVLQVNIRASQGGAARVSLDLHHRLRLAGIDSHLIYGYASGITDDPMVIGDRTIERIGTRPAVLFNYAMHSVFGCDLITGSKEKLRASISWADVVHLHAPHHYFLRWRDLVRLVREYGKPMVATAHDWWFITGRCGFTEDCEAWKHGCGQCGLRRFKDPVSLLDLSRVYRKRKIASIECLGRSIQFVCPAQHLAVDYQIALPNTSVKVIPNCLDMGFEKALDVTEGLAVSREGILFSAADLSSRLKIDHALVDDLAQSNVKLILVGRNNPFRHNAEVCGEVRERNEMVRILRRARALVFCSLTDISPLTIIEALSAGCFVLAYASPAAEEIISKVDGRTIPDRKAMIDVITKNEIENLYGGIDSHELARRSRAKFSGERIMNAYLESYADALKSGSE
jgi:putative colanic acid biosynthesis glycosyltransferase